MSAAGPELNHSSDSEPTDPAWQSLRGDLVSRALGGRGSHVATLVFLDVILVLFAGTALAAAILLAVQPLAQSFAESTFQVSGVAFLRPAMIPELILGEFVVLILAGTWPAFRAVRQDPLDVLEPRGS